MGDRQFAFLESSASGKGMGKRRPKSLLGACQSDPHLSKVTSLTSQLPYSITPDPVFSSGGAIEKSRTEKGKQHTIADVFKIHK